MANELDSTTAVYSRALKTRGHLNEYPHTSSPKNSFYLYPCLLFQISRFQKLRIDTRLGSKYLSIGLSEGENEIWEGDCCGCLSCAVDPASYVVC